MIVWVLSFSTFDPGSKSFTIVNFFAAGVTVYTPVPAALMVNEKSLPSSPELWKKST